MYCVLLMAFSYLKGFKGFRAFPETKPCEAYYKVHGKCQEICGFPVSGLQFSINEPAFFHHFPGFSRFPRKNKSRFDILLFKRNFCQKLN